jgi:hypothetical protein
MKNKIPHEWQEEWDYRYQERLGILCGQDRPTEAQEQIASREANEAVAALQRVQG